jgi:hypothetical protein
LATPAQRRGEFLESVAARLRGTDADLDAAVHAALRDLMQAPAA